jgi:hypothetical protein
MFRMAYQSEYDNEVSVFVDILSKATQSLLREVDTCLASAAGPSRCLEFENKSTEAIRHPSQPENSVVERS